MAKTLTIVARDTSKVAPANPPEAWLLDGNGDGQLQDVLDKLKHRDKNEHILARAGSVQELVDVLLEHEAHLAASAPKVIQIIAHGDVGELQLGIASWPDPAEDEGTAFVLDSDRGSYGVLKECVAASCKVLLLGCDVGESLRGSSGDGPILLFDLSHMLGCTVAAPADAIYAEHFDAGGIFPADDAGLSSVTNDVLTLGVLTSSDERGAGSRPSVTFERIRSARSATRRTMAAIDLREDLRIGSREVRVAELEEQTARLATLIGDPVAREPVLASPGFVFDGQEDGARVTIEVLAHGRFVRLRRSTGPARVFSVTDRAAFNGAITQLARLVGLSPS